MTNKTSIAVIGAGKWGQNLIRTFAELGVLTAIVDVEKERAKQLAEQYGVAHYQTVDDLLLTNVKAVAIATPVFSHYEVAKKALLAQKDVFIEKPMTMTVAEADELIKVADDSQRVLMVGHLLLYQPAIKFIKKFLSQGKLGAIHSIRQVRRSLGTIRKEENVLYSFGVHDLAVLSYLIDEEIATIICTSQAIISEGIADDMTVHLRYSSGIHAHLHLTWLWPIKDRHLMILGEKGALFFDEANQQLTYYHNHGNPDTSITEEGSQIIFTERRAPLTLELEHFIDCIHSRAMPLSSGLQGRNVIQLMANIMEAQELHDTRIFSS